MKKLKFGMINCQGLRTKFETPEFIELVSQNSIFGVCETWCNDQEVITLSGFNFYSINRKSNKGKTRGGIGMFIKQELTKATKIIYELSDENMLWCKLDKKHLNIDNDLFLGCIYIPPQNSSKEKRLNKDHFERLKNTMLNIESINMILLGEFNARTQNKNDVLAADKHENVDFGDFYSSIKSLRVNQDKGSNTYGSVHILRNQFFANFPPPSPIM